MTLDLFALSMVMAAALCFLGGYFVGRLDKAEPVLRWLRGGD